MGFFDRLGLLLLTRPLVTATLLVVTALALSSGAIFLRTDFSARLFFGGNDPALETLESYAEAWGTDEDVLMVVAQDPAGGSVLTPEHLASLEALTRALRTDPDVLAAVGPTGFVRPPRLPLMPPRSLLADVPQRPEDLPAWQRAVLSDPALVPDFVSADGAHAAILVRLATESEDLSSARPVVRRVDALIEANRGDLEVRTGGIPALRARLLDVILTDNAVFLPIAVAGMAIALLALFGSVQGLVVPLIAALVPLLVLLGAMGWAGEPIGILNQTLLALVPVISVADAVHLVHRFREEAAATATGPTLDAKTRHAATRVTLRHLGVACFMTSFTTIVGFLSLNASSMAVLRSYGTWAAIGIAIAYVTAITFVPLALWSTRKAPPPLSNSRIRTGFTHALSWASDRSLAHPWLALGGAAVLITVCGLGAFRVEADYHVSSALLASHPTAQANAIVDAHLGGLQPLDLDLRGPPGTFVRPGVLRALDEADAHARTLPDVRTVWSPSSVVETVSATRGAGRTLPPTAEGIEASLRIAEIGSPAFRMVDADRGRARMIVRMRDVGARTHLVLSADLTRDVRERLEPLGVQVVPTGETWLASRGLTGVMTDLRDSLLLALAVITVLIAFLLRSVRIGLVSMVPNLIPLAVGYGLLGWLGWPLDPPAAVVFTVALGLSVDNTIHILARFAEERRAGRPQHEAVHVAVEHSGSAVAVTAVILAIGFGVNSLSSFPGIAVFGTIGAIIVLSALISNLIVLPALLTVVPMNPRRWRTERAPPLA